MTYTDQKRVSGAGKPNRERRLARRLNMLDQAESKFHQSILNDLLKSMVEKSPVNDQAKRLRELASEMREKLSRDYVRESAD